MTESMKVTIVAMDVGPVGGMERQLSEMVTGLLASGHRVTVVARTCELEFEVPPTFCFKRVPVPQRPIALAFPLFVLVASGIVARTGGDIVHVNGGIVLNRADAYTMHFCHRAYQRKYTKRERSRGGLFRRLNGRASEAMTSAMESYCLRGGRVRRVIGISHGVAREVSDAYPAVADRVEVIPYGLDHERFRVSSEAREQRREQLGLEPGQLAAVFVGGDWERKGLSDAIQALAAAPEWTLLVVGRGDRARHEEVARRAGVGERVRFLGPERFPEATYNAADAFVFPTRYETFSLVSHEAAACGLPLLVTEVHGVDELIDPGSNGWFIQRDPQDIASRLRALAGLTAPQRRAMAHAAELSSQRYEWRSVVATHLALYETLRAQT